jgi:streptomycin 6-kinase
VQIPEGLSEKIVRVHGARGLQWIEQLPDLISYSSRRWSLKLGQPFTNLSYNLVLAATGADGADLVLKLGVPCLELQTEASALDLFRGIGAVRLLDHDAPRGILLSERVVPGTPIHEMQSDLEAARTAATLMRQLWRSPPTNQPFPALATWFQAFDRLRNKFSGGTGPFPAKLIEKAERAFADLNESTDRSVILHGDLHHTNILFSRTRGWLAIDPKGICGDAGYEVGPFMLNQLPVGASESARLETFAQRLSVFSDELNINRERLAQWSFCHAVLSALWDFEESAEWFPTMKLAETLAHLR